MKNLKLADIRIGMKSSLEKTITREMIEAFAQTSGDVSPIHTSLEYAQKQGHKDILAHGHLTSSFFPTITGMQLPGGTSLSMNAEFNYTLPVYPGDRLTYEAEVIEVNSEFKFINLKLDCTNQDGQKVIRGKMRVGVKE